RRWAAHIISARWLVDDCFMAHYCPPICEISAFHPAFNWRGSHHTLLQLRRGSILRAAATRRSFPLGCPVWLLERRRRAWSTEISNEAKILWLFFEETFQFAARLSPTFLSGSMIAGDFLRPS